MAQHAGSAGSFFRKPAPPAAPPPPTFRPPLPPSGLGVPDAVPPPLPAARRRLSFHGTGGTLFGIHVVNVLFTVLTLGVYYFWGKTRIRRYLFGESAFEGDRFAYHGTAQELLLGFVKAFVVFFVPIVVLTVVRDVLDVGPVIKGAAAVSISLLFLMFLPVAMVGARRYRLSRTSWRGIRFSFRGAAFEFVKIFVKGTFLTGLTFGLYYPFFVTRRQAFMIAHSYFGNERFDFDGRGRELFGPYLLSVLLTLPTLGLCWVWFLARKRRFFWEHTTFGRGPVRLDGHGRRAARPLGGQCHPARLHAWPRLAVGAGEEYQLRLPLPRAGRTARPRAHPAAGPAGVRHGRGPGRLPRHRLRPRLER